MMRPMKAKVFAAVMGSSASQRQLDPMEKLCGLLQMMTEIAKHSMVIVKENSVVQT